MKCGIRLGGLVTLCTNCLLSYFIEGEREVTIKRRRSSMHLHDYLKLTKRTSKLERTHWFALWRTRCECVIRQTM
jgi:hypothetical protein